MRKASKMSDEDELARKSIAAFRRDVYNAVVGFVVDSFGVIDEEATTKMRADAAEKLCNHIDRVNASIERVRSRMIADIQVDPGGTSETVITCSRCHAPLTRTVSPGSWQCSCIYKPEDGTGADGWDQAKVINTEKG